MVLPDEPPVGARIRETATGHEWYRGDRGWWHCDCDRSSVDWAWDEILDDLRGGFEPVVGEGARR